MTGIPWGAIFMGLAFLVFAGMVILSGVWGLRAGRSEAREDAAEDAAKVKDEQLDIANARARTPRELADRLRRGSAH